MTTPPTAAKIADELDSGAFSEISTHGRYRFSVADYATEIRRWVNVGKLELVVAQDYMCEKFILDKTGLTIPDHQRLTIERYDALIAENLPVAVMPVLQGYDPQDYANHVRMYGSRLIPGMRVGVGSVCKRNSNPKAIVAVLKAIKALRPDLKLHGFGIKKTSLKNPDVYKLLYSTDSMAWSYGARFIGKQNDWREAKKYEIKIQRIISRNSDLFAPL